MSAISETNTIEARNNAITYSASKGSALGGFCMINMIPLPIRELVQKILAPAQRFEVWGQSGFLLLLRMLYGFMFAQAGWGKLVHFDQSVAFFASLGMPAPEILMPVAALTEFLGGLALLVGLASRFAALSLSFVMLTALMTAHAAEAFASIEGFTSQAPYPFLIAALIVLAFGAGRFSMDSLISWRMKKLAAASEAK